MDGAAQRDSGSRVLIVSPPSREDAVDELRATLSAGERFSVSVRLIPESAAAAPVLRGGAGSPAVVILVLGRSGADRVKESLTNLRDGDPTLPVVMVAEEDTDPERLSRWLERGTSDFLSRPFRPADVLARLERLSSRRREEDHAVSRLKEQLGLEQMVGQSEVFLDQIRRIPVIARCSSSVLIQGETGTGKEIVARSIHHLSARCGGPFIAVSCAGIPEALAENELWGHAKGAFTGASHKQRGLVAEADGGTLLLDDVDCLPLPVQAKLLRFLQEKEYRPLGSTDVHQSDVRVLASSNLELREATVDGRFRLDLFHRLNVVPMHLPPLRERMEDIPLLADHFLHQHARDLGVVPPRLPGAVMDVLLSHDWPGNVRELKHVMERAVVLSRGGSVAPAELMLPLQGSSPEPTSFQEAKALLIRRFERRYLERQLRAHDGNLSRAARASGKHRRAFYALVRKHDIDVDRFRA